METYELYLRAVAGDRLAFTEWCMENQVRIGRFGFQNGIPLTEMNAYQTAVFRKVHSSLEAVKPDEAENELWVAAVELLTEYRKEDMSLESAEALRFEEDRETHEAVHELGARQRIPFTLAYFNRKNLKEISKILKEPEQQLVDAIAEAKALVARQLRLDGESAIEKRLEFVEKSYARISFSFSEADVFAEKPDQVNYDKPGVQKAETTAKRTTLLLGATGLFISGVIGASFLLDDPNPNINASTSIESEETVTNQMVEDWRAAYSAVRESSPERLGVDAKVYEQFAYVQEADAAMKRVLGKEHIKKMKNEPEKMQREVDKLLLKIETPKGMELAAPNAYLTGEEVQAFFNNYKVKTNELMAANEKVLQQYASELAAVTFNGELSAEKLMANNEDFPEEIERLVDGLWEQGLTIAKHPAKDRFITRRVMETFYSNDALSSYFSSSNHLNLLMNEPYFDDGGLLVPIEGMSFSLAAMEEALISEDRSSEIFEDYAPIFMQSFWLVLKGSENEQVFGKDGMVKPEFQQTWKDLSMQTGNPLIHIMLPIIKEMEASGWTESESYSQLAYQDIMEAVELEKEGKLAERLPNGKVTVKSAQMNLAQVDLASIKQLYRTYSQKHDRNLLEGVPPLDILLLFDYAHELEDAETIWHLLSDDETKPSLDEFLLTWRQLPSLREEAYSIEVAEDSVYRIGGNLLLQPYVSYKEERLMMPLSPVLITAGNDTWLLKSQMAESYDLTGKETDFIGKVKKFYKAYSAQHDDSLLKHISAGEIGGMFLFAMEKGDVKTMMALSEESVQNQQPEFFQSQAAQRGITSLTELTYLNFNIEAGYYGIGNPQTNGQLTFESGTGAAQNVNHLTMVKTGEGWRIGDLNIY